MALDYAKAKAERELPKEFRKAKRLEKKEEMQRGVLCKRVNLNNS
jgi:hypothetical protein